MLAAKLEHAVPTLMAGDFVPDSVLGTVTKLVEDQTRRDADKKAEWLREQATQDACYIELDDSDSGFYGLIKHALILCTIDCRNNPPSSIYSEHEKKTFPSSKLLFDLVCPLALRLMVHFILSRRPAATTANVSIVLPRHFTAPPLGLIDLARSSSAPLILSVSVGRQNAPPRSSLAPPSSAPLLLPPSVGRHNAPPRSSLAPPSSAPLLLPPSVGRHNARRRSALRGQLLVEVFAAYSDFPFRGTITIMGGTASNCIYNRPGRDADADFYSQKNEWLTTHADDSEFKSKLPLTGPGCSISAYWGLSISAFFPGIDEEYTACYDSPDDYCSMLNHPDTITITTNMGSLYVTCAVLSDAVQANLKLMVRLPFLYVFADMYGHVMAYIGTFQIGTTIYSRENKNSEDLTDYQDGEEIGPKLCLPLDQSLLAEDPSDDVRSDREDMDQKSRHVLRRLKAGDIPYLLGPVRFKCPWCSRKEMPTDFLGMFQHATYTGVGSAKTAPHLRAKHAAYGLFLKKYIPRQ
ncbi:hypothetical protein ACQ4PT_002518 [Festuca glaucescens]